MIYTFNVYVNVNATPTVTGVTINGDGSVADIISGPVQMATNAGYMDPMDPGMSGPFSDIYQYKINVPTQTGTQPGMITATTSDGGNFSVTNNVETYNSTYLVTSSGSTHSAANLPASAPPNTAPVFNSPSDITTSNTQSGSLYVASATDAEGNPILYGEDGIGTGAGLFNVDSASGAITIVNPDGSMAPGTYTLNLSANDGASTAFMSLAITVTAVVTLPRSYIFAGSRGVLGGLGARNISFESSVLKQFGQDIDNQTGGDIVLNNAYLLGLSGSPAGNLVHQFDISIMRSAGGMQMIQGGTINLSTGDAETRQGADLDDGTVEEASDFTITIPDGDKVRVRWVEISA